MAGRLLLCLLLLCALTNYSLCRKFSFGRGSSRSGSSWGRWGSSSANKPSFSSSFGNSKPTSTFNWFGSRSSAPKYPSSSSGLSGFGSSAHKYPSSSSGLSGFSSSGPKYPSSSSGLSGGGSSLYPASSSGLSGFTWNAPSTFGSNKYPSSTGLSGTGSDSKYPASTGMSGTGSGSKYPYSTGFSGTGSGSKYPASTGLSGTGSGSKYPASTGLSGMGSGSSKYPASTGWSGTGSLNKYPSSTGLSGPHNYYPTTSNTNIKPSVTQLSTNSYNNHPGYGSGYSSGSQNYGHGRGSNGYSHGIYNTPTYYTAPQRIYITEYQNSGSRYSDLLTGLTLYNLGRSHSDYHHNYYNDDYYRRRYYNSGTTSYEKPKEEAHCTLKIKEDNKVDILKIPCEIVSTFTDGSKKVASETVNQTVCVSNYTVINNTIPATTTVSSLSANGTVAIVQMPIFTNANISALNATVPFNASIAIAEAQSNFVNTSNLNSSNNVSISIINSTSSLNVSVAPNINSSISNQNMSTSLYTPLLSEISNITTSNNSTADKPKDVSTNSTPFTVTSSNVTVINTTNCIVTTDPLTVKGPPVNTSNIECEVDIITKNSHTLRSKVDCNILMQYAKMPEPKKESSGILPDRKKLKSWLSNPPWWMSLFIAV